MCTNLRGDHCKSGNPDKENEGGKQYFCLNALLNVYAKKLLMEKPPRLINVGQCEN